MRQIFRGSLVAIALSACVPGANAQVNYSTDHLIRVETPEEEAAYQKGKKERDAAYKKFLSLQKDNEEMRAKLNAMTPAQKAEMHAYVEKLDAEEAAGVESTPSVPVDDDPNSFLRELDEIDATHEPPCGICDPITPATPSGTYTLPAQNR